MSHPTEQTAGAAIGGTLGLIKSLSIITVLTWQSVWETAALAAVGALVGFLITALLKYLKRKITDR
jgi:hypothetical protein